MAENRLAGESSPYLLQHKDNPVDWYPWGGAAFAAAKAANKPVLLSIGYAACHWCHVMAHESFESQATAGLMNELFVNIKVDREERPDLDVIYQHALALLGEHGGWPLTMFLTPDGEPFWGGTYFPPSSRFGRPAFPDVLRRLAQIYAAEPDKVAANVDALRQALARLSHNQSGDALPVAMLEQAAGRLLAEVDPVHGGLGGAPKFPQPAILKLFWRAWKRSGREPYRRAVDLTLTRMCQGGIYDHLGGGFARYAVDNAWLVPHFEKMLYDNAQLIEVLTWVWQDGRQPLYEQRVRETITWVLREMMAAEDPAAITASDAFASSLDADSEGEEGKFYVWTEGEIDRVLGPDAEVFKRAYGVTAQGNWEGRTILNRSAAPDLGDDDHEARLAALRRTLLAARAARTRPGWDDKVLADWNGLMITALARASGAFSEPRWLAAAERAFAFVVDRMTLDGRLHHSWRRGVLKHPATLDDYANLAAAALALDDSRGDARYRHHAEDWVQVLERHYWDSESDGYFLTADDTERLIVRTKTVHDAAVPAGNATMLDVLARLYYLTGKDLYRRRAESLVRAFAGEVERNMFPLATLLNANALYHQALQIVIAGSRDADDTRALLAAVDASCLPDRILQTVGPDEALASGHPAAGKGMVAGRAAAYLCRGTTCSLPITEPAGLARALAP